MENYVGDYDGNYDSDCIVSWMRRVSELDAEFNRAWKTHLENRIMALSPVCGEVREEGGTFNGSIPEQLMSVFWDALGRLGLLKEFHVGMGYETEHVEPNGFKDEAVGV